MNKFYGGGSASAGRSANASARSQGLIAPDASTLHGPSREGISGERQSPDAGTARPFDEHEYAEQMRRGFAMKYGSPHAADWKA